MIAIVPLVLTFSQVRADNFSLFCEMNPTAYYCEARTEKVLNEKCGSKISDITFPGANYPEFIKTINSLRVKLAKGEESYEGTNFPTVGDMIEIAWSKELQIAAENSVRYCNDPNAEPDPAKRIVPSIKGDKIGFKYFTQLSSEEMLDKYAITTNVTRFINEELASLATYVKQKGSVPNLIFYGKNRLIGCGNVHFKNKDESPEVWKLYTLCFFSPAGMPLTPTIQFDKKPCSVCPDKTDCRKTGDYANVLCGWSGAINVLAGKLFVMSVFFFSYLLM